MIATSELFAKVHAMLADDPCWRGLLEPGSPKAEQVGIHLAVLTEPYLQFILSGHKTVESRFSMKAIAPFRRVVPGDAILLKRVAGPVVGLCRVDDAWFYELEGGLLDAIRHRYVDSLCVSDPGFWAARQDAKFATLLALSHARSMPALPVAKRDRRGWVVLRSNPYEEIGTHQWLSS